jgi:hypothetical protein
MPLWPFLLRVLLCVALVLNGTTAAVAAVTLEHQMAGSSETAPASSPASAHGCHDEASARAPAAVADQAQEAPKPGSAEHPAPDCCAKATCNCACVQAAQVGSPVVATGAVVPKSAQLQSPPDARRAEPVLPHLIRPPIG